MCVCVWRKTVIQDNDLLEIELKKVQTTENVPQNFISVCWWLHQLKDGSVLIHYMLNSLVLKVFLDFVSYLDVEMASNPSLRT